MIETLLAHNCELKAQILAATKDAHPDKLVFIKQIADAVMELYGFKDLARTDYSYLKDVQPPEQPTKPTEIPKDEPTFKKFTKTY